MKKWMIMILAAVMLLTLAACSPRGGDGEDTNPPESPQSSGVQPEAPEISSTPAEPDVPAEQPDILLPDPDKGEGDVITDTGGDSSTPVIHVSHTDVTLKASGETFRFTVWDSNGNDPDTCTYTSDDPTIACVDEGGGEVTAIAPGITTVTAHVEFNGEKVGFSCIVRCSWEDTEGEEPSLPAAAELPSLSEFFTALQGSCEGLDAMMVMEGELLENYYPGLSDITAVEEILIQETMISISNVAVGLVKLSSDATLDDVVAVQNILQGRITAQAEGGAWYPESCEIWEKGVITSTSNVVGMFVHPDNAQAMADLFTAAFTN